MLNRLKIHSSFHDYADAIRECESFTAGKPNAWDDRPGTLWGRLGSTSGTHRNGQLPAEYRESLNHADYVIYSYITPIAWRDSRGYGWTIPDVHYSQATSQHQSTIRTAISVL